MPLNLIVIDDETDIFKLYELFLKSEISSNKIELTCFSDAKKCIDHINNKGVDNDHTLVLSDINMPEMDGYQFLEKAKKIEPELKIYMVSAYSQADYIAKAKKLGAIGLIGKPVDFLEIKKIIFSYLKN